MWRRAEVYLGSLGCRHLIWVERAHKRQASSRLMSPEQASISWQKPR